MIPRMFIIIQMENKQIAQSQSHLAAQRNLEFAHTLRNSNLKHSQIVVEPCCSRHYYCVNYQHNHEEQSDEFQLNSELLEEIEAKDISSQPMFQYESKPQVEVLTEINIKKKQYEKIMLKYQKQLDQQQKKDKLEQVRKQAQLALQNSKKMPKGTHHKWGHSLFQIKPEEKQENLQQNKEEKQKLKNKKEDDVKQKKKIVLKDINERIADYKQKQLQKARSAQNLKKTVRADLNINDCNDKVKQNADKILQQMKDDEQKIINQKKIVQAKIRAIQLKSLKKVQHSKKAPFQPGEFDLGDSQYSTFQARAAGRKMEKKKKKTKQKVPEPVLMQTQKTKQSKPSSKRSKSYKQVQKTVPRNKQNQEQSAVVESEAACPQQQKGPFFIWNMPIMPQDVQKLQRPSKDIFMNVDRFNYKQGKTFREEANEFLANKMQQKFKEARKETKDHIFMVEVERKKQQLQEQFEKANSAQIGEVLWNEDEVFRPNILENFHFFPREDF